MENVVKIFFFDEDDRRMAYVVRESDERFISNRDPMYEVLSGFTLKSQSPIGTRTHSTLSLQISCTWKRYKHCDILETEFRSSSDPFPSMVQGAERCQRLLPGSHDNASFLVSIHL